MITVTKLSLETLFLFHSAGCPRVEHVTSNVLSWLRWPSCPLKPCFCSTVQAVHELNKLRDSSTKIRRDGEKLWGILSDIGGKVTFCVRCILHGHVGNLGHFLSGGDHDLLLQFIWLTNDQVWWALHFCPVLLCMLPWVSFGIGSESFVNRCLMVTCHLPDQCPCHQEW